MAFSFTKLLTDIIAFPSKPGSGALARKQFQDMFDEVANYLNTATTGTLTLYSEMNGTATYTKDNNGNVMINLNLIKSGTSNDINGGFNFCNLPSILIPKTQLFFAGVGLTTAVGRTMAEFWIQSNGILQVGTGSVQNLRGILSYSVN